MNTILGALQVAHLSGLPENRPTDRPIHLAEKFPLLSAFSGSCSARPPGRRRIKFARIIRPKSRARLPRNSWTRRPAEHSYGCADVDCIEKRDGILFRQANAAVGGGISGQNSGVHSGRTIEANEIMHRARHKPAAARHPHVGVCIGENGAAVPIFDPTIDRRIMISLLFQDAE